MISLLRKVKETNLISHQQCLLTLTLLLMIQLLLGSWIQLLVTDNLWWILGNGHHISISSISNRSFCVNDKCFFPLNTLLHMLHTITNLLSVNQLCANNKFIVELHPNVIWRINVWGKILQGISEGGLYKVKGKCDIMLMMLVQLL